MNALTAPDGPSPRSGSRRRRGFGRIMTLGALALLWSGSARAEPAPGAAAPGLGVPAEARVVAAPAERTERDLAVRGIYVQQTTAQDGARLEQLIAEARAAGFNTFVVDLWSRSPEYEKAIQTIRAAGITYVPRITVFPDGARPGQNEDRRLLERRWRMIDYALKLGAEDIQLDYIRFSSQNASSPQNATKIREVLRFFRQRIEARGARLQIDVFGEVSYGPSARIGQDMRLFAPELSAVCPMLYPSHFEPYREAARAPYETVNNAIRALEKQIEASPIAVYPFIESFNYRYRMSDSEREAYFEAQLEAVLHSGARGFFVWSVGNHYEIPFKVLERRAAERALSGAALSRMSSAAPAGAAAAAGL